VRFEAALYEVLAVRVPEHVLVPLAVDAERGWVLLPDGGPSGEVDVAAALPAYAALQRGLEPEELVARGVADMRPAVMPERFEEALEAASRTATTDGRAVLERVPAARPAFLEDCARLADSPGGASLDHNDLHPGNVLAGPRFYDWGDAVVAHPFASLLVPLQMGVDTSAYLDAFADLAPPAELAATAELAVRVAHVARALVWARALAGAAPGSEHRERFGDAPARTLDALL
jgi:hypothetical protein